MPSPGETMETVFATLQLDRLISLHIGDSTTPPILIPQSTLVRTSDFFRGALTRDCKENKEGRIYFPEDNLNDWKVLVYWITADNLPGYGPEDNDGGAEHIKNFSAWYLGDRLCMAGFQDDMIRYMSRTFYKGIEKSLRVPSSDEDEETPEEKSRKSAEINELFMRAFEATEQGGTPRRFVADRLVKYMQEERGTIQRNLTWNDVPDVRKVPAYTLDIVEAMAAFEAENVNKRPDSLDTLWRPPKELSKYLCRHDWDCGCDKCRREHPHWGDPFYH